MDKEVRPQDPHPEKIRSKRRRWRSKYECFVSKGDHVYELIKPDHVRGQENLLTVEVYYEQADRRVDEQRAKDDQENAAREANGLPRRNYWRGAKWRYYRCVHCGHREYDYKDQPKKYIREKLHDRRGS